ncbi:cation-translocating P-type ATPase [Candidatus Sulfurimonas baltica]|uniref:Cation-transporting P-type ATPase n=1 Tax=Candidatus Sulfurimonas baltica TaxID=2740404 RepID=A0A7S7LUX5_9BACT|nr:cation-transporting P-type ATPase [Candidatus Sulfurimonas baltica]QOY51954.1 cation-transporting P-type ATPase [Candidatus Sulfurimonas baltica]
MQPYKLNSQELFESFHTSKNGLSTKEANRRIVDFGENKIQSQTKKNYLLEYLKQYIQFFALLLEVAAFLAFIADYYAPNEGNDILAYAILIAVIINATFAFWQEYKADKAMEALVRLMPSMVTLVRDGEVKTIDAKDLVPGDIIILEEGNKIAADAVLIKNTTLYINTSSLNGESRPSRRELEIDSNITCALDARNMVFAGTAVISGSAEAVVVSTGQSTEFGKIATLTKNVQKTITPMQKEVIRITHILTIIALGMGLLFFLFGVFSEQSLLMASIFALSLIVANVPEGMLPTITLSLSLASQRMAKRNALIKNLDSVQTLGSATVICTDKTGTLTRNEMTLKELVLAGGEYITVGGEGYATEGEFDFDNSNESSQTRLDEILTAGFINCRATIEDKKLFGDPTELAIVVAAKKRNIDLSSLEKIDEIPFTSERKMMSSVCIKSEEKILYIKGAAEVIFEKATHFLDKDQAVKIFDDDAKKRMQMSAEAFENEAYRVLAIAKNSDIIEEGLTLLGLVAIMDLPREEVKEAIAQCKTAGIRTMMITGDNSKTAQAIAKKIGLEFDRVLTGDEVRMLREEELEKILSKESVLFARMASNQKLKIAIALQNCGEIVAMTGDGVNDAPALKRADIGIAMGISGTDVAKEAADMILLDDNFNSIVAAIEEGRAVYFNIKKFVTYILSSNVPEIVPYILHFFLLIPLPLSVIQILSIDLGSDMLPGLALGSEKPEKNIMKSPPVGRGEKILDWEVFKRGYFFIGVIEATAAMVAFISFLSLHGWEYGTVDLKNPLLQSQAMTMTLLGAISCQLVNVWTMRSWEYSAWSVGWTSNRLLLGAMALEFLWIWMMLSYEPVQKIFHTASIPLNELWILLPFPMILFVSHEYYKYTKRSEKANLI